MNYNLHKNEKGLTTIVIVILAVVILGGLGYVGWMVMNKDKTTTTSTTKAEEDALKVSEKACLKEVNDKDVCKLFTNMNQNKKFMIEATSTAEGTTTKMTMKIDGDNYYLKTEGAAAMDVISIGNSTYTKAGDTWWKQTTKATTDTTPKLDTSKFKFEAPKADTPEASKTKYVKVGKEACGKLTCVKYKITDPSDAGSTTYVWFDTHDYLIRKMSQVSADGSVSDMIFSYTNASVTVPSPVKELGENQYILPGQTEPQTMPSAADLTQ